MISYLVLLLMERFIYINIEAETKRLEAKIEAESHAEVNKIEMDKQIMAKESLKRMEEIENEIFIKREMSKADAHYYKVSKMIEAEQKQLTPEFLKKLAIESFATNTKLYFGESIPKFIIENVDKILSKDNEAGVTA